jgi:hypothetical protein
MAAVAQGAKESGFKRFLKGCGIFFGLALLGFVLIGGTIGYFVYKGARQIMDNPGFVPVAGAQCAYDRAAGDRALAEALSGDVSLGYPVESYDQVYVRTYVKDGLYDYLDTLLTAYADSVRRDYRLEYRMFDLYDAFAVSDSSLKPFLDAWVTERPQSANARLVRATWLTETGIDARGTEWASETPDSSMSALEWHLNEAKKDIAAAHAIDPCSLVTYHLLMEASAYNGSRFLSRKLLDQALTIQPLSFIMRVRHMNNLTPRWGGSYKAMEAFAAESDSLIARNPRLRALHGFGVADRADESEREKDTLRAIARYDSALTYGDFWRFRLDRGEFLYRIDLNESAQSDLEAALVQRPQSARVLHYLGEVHYDTGRLLRGEQRLERYREAWRYNGLALALDPSDKQALKSREFFLKNMPPNVTQPPGG